MYLSQSLPKMLRRVLHRRYSTSPPPRHDHSADTAMLFWMNMTLAGIAMKMGVYDETIKWIKSKWQPQLNDRNESKYNVPVEMEVSDLRRRVVFRNRLDTPR